MDDFRDRPRRRNSLLRSLKPEIPRRPDGWIPRAHFAPRSIRFATPEPRVHIQRVDFVLDAAPPTKSDEAQKKRKAEPIGPASRAAAYGSTPASSADVVASSSTAQKPVAAANPQPPGAGRAPRVSKELFPRETCVVDDANMERFGTCPFN